MRDFKKDSSASTNLSRFGRDRRERPSDNRSEERRPRSQRDAADSGNPRSAERRSFNPNFTRDNRPNSGVERGERRPYG